MTCESGRASPNDPMNLIALAIPAFLVLIVVEALIAKARHRQVYRFNDAVTDLGCGLSSQIVSSVLMGAMRTAIYIGVFSAYRLWDLDALGLGVAGQWVLGIVGVDLLYYWWHRGSHEINLLWAAHIVHHHSEDYNLAVALRQAWFTAWTALPLFLLLALLGLPPHIYLVSKAVNSLYQFWIHTELIDRLGPLEWVLNTPSHHRVHHAVNDEYLDRNYGGILILWDRLFGTFEPERAPPVYGTTTPLRSFSPLWANVHHFVDVTRRSRSFPRLRDRVRVWLAHPAWSPGGGDHSIAPEELARRKAHKFSTDRTGPWIKAYIVLQLLAAIYGTSLLLGNVTTITPQLALIAGGLVVTATAVWGGLFEGKRWAWPVELVRLGAAALLLSMLI